MILEALFSGVKAGKLFWNLPSRSLVGLKSKKDLKGVENAMPQ